ncbi:ABC transporter permease [Donghicola tyrosinivorans]|uniref:ABC-2 type transport system permease protein n=1 Tax=Donghicola tyrosinivorans TaxID=1652492 RepID=A0A2T0WDP6_9RHOB|nr:ABC transporter permease subunit [Donghicola tyrosinivorans]PRY84833.1 ABC-2 type transport system permease protein [Donghicola tyrosinivorans]
MPDTLSPMARMATIGLRDAREALRDGFVLVAIAALTLAALVSFVTGAIALNGDAATYAQAKALLLKLGKDVSVIAAPELYPLKLLRGTVEQIEIMGAVIALVAGYRAAAAERGSQALALILTRPLHHWQYLAAKLAGGAGLAAVLLAVVFTVTGMLLPWVSGVALSAGDALRLVIAWGAGVLYLAGIYAMGFGLSLWARSPAAGLITAFALWLMVVLVAPQIGDTMDPDNQVAGGIYAQLSVPKAEQDRIKAGFALYETIRGGIEQASVTKHYERLTFAVLGIKDSYTGKPLGPILTEKRGDLLFLLFFTLGIGGVVLLRPINPDRLTKET